MSDRQQRRPPIEPFSEHDRGPMLTVEFLDGSANSYAYAHLVSISYSVAPSEEIKLDYHDLQVFLAGHGLKPIFGEVARHMIGYVRLVDPLSASAHRGSLVTSIRIQNRK